MPRTIDSSNAPAYRRKAAMCGNLADCAQSAGDRRELLRMRESWLALAANAEWLNELPPTPPDGANALAATRHH
jgi:hypothetical protein